MIEIREERVGDDDAIRHVNREAFGQTDEAEIVDALRTGCNDLLSLVAVDGDAIVGHVLFSPATLGGVDGMALAPMAVLPRRQREGIGSRLVKRGLEKLKERGCPFVIVLGHADYYPRFGFQRASDYGVRCKWDVPDDAFRILRLDERALEGVSGLAHYRPEFG